MSWPQSSLNPCVNSIALQCKDFVAQILWPAMSAMEYLGIARNSDLCQEQMKTGTLGAKLKKQLLKIICGYYAVYYWSTNGGISTVYNGNNTFVISWVNNIHLSDFSLQMIVSGVLLGLSFLKKMSPKMHRLNVNTSILYWSYLKISQGRALTLVCYWTTGSRTHGSLTHLANRLRSPNEYWKLINNTFCPLSPCRLREPPWPMWGPTSSGATTTSRPSWRTNMSWSQLLSSSVSAWRCSFWACWDAVPQSQSPKSASAWCVWPVFEFLLLIIDYFVFFVCLYGLVRCYRT